MQKIFQHDVCIWLELHININNFVIKIVSMFQNCQYYHRLMANHLSIIDIYNKGYHPAIVEWNHYIFTLYLNHSWIGVILLLPFLVSIQMQLSANLFESFCLYFMLVDILDLILIITHHSWYNDSWDLPNPWKVSHGSIYFF